jgi:CpXC protein
MTRRGSFELECPGCGKKQETMVCHTINVTLNPELREQLLKGEINVFRCESCGTKAFIETPVLYHDMTRQYSVQYLPFEYMNNETFLRGFTADGQQKFTVVGEQTSKTNQYLLLPHIVFDLAEMARYIRFRDRLFDLHEDN